MDVNRKFTTKFVSEVFLELRIFLYQISTSVFDFLAFKECEIYFWSDLKSIKLSLVTEAQ